MHDVDAFPDEIFGFHAQQSVEKAFMSPFYANEEPVDRSELADSIELLIGQVEAELRR